MANSTVERPTEDDIRGHDLRDIYRLMLLTRRLEESVYRKFHEAKIGGYLHRYDGMEALVAGVIPLLELPGDYVLSTYRDHAHALACGTPPQEVMAELMGRATGCAAGKGGSMHLTDPARGFLGGDGIVGGPVPVSLGVGWALKYRESRNICVCYFGDGAMNQGGVHEAFNMVGLYKLPVLYILENNQYAMGTSIKRSSAEPLLYRRGEAHRIPGLQVDGMDVLAVRGAAQVALDWTRSGKGPIIIEFLTYRYRGHSMSDPAKYRTREEVQDVREHRDPIVHAERDLEAMGVKEEELKAIDKQIKDIVVNAAKFAEDAPEPAPAELYTDVLVGSY